MGMKRKSIPPAPAAKGESEALDALNVQIHRRADTARLIEATIEAKAKKRRREESSGSPPRKRGR
jgi:hypothetical protein